jgi:hypothetical protein
MVSVFLTQIILNRFNKTTTGYAGLAVLGLWLAIPSLIVRVFLMQSYGLVTNSQVVPYFLEQLLIVLLQAFFWIPVVIILGGQRSRIFEAFKAYDFIVTPDSPMDVFYPQLTSREYTTIWYIDSLKRHGRGYMKEAPFDSNKGYELLGKVRYSLDCLYLHLRENPALCYGKRNSLLEDLDTKPAAKRRKT